MTADRRVAGGARASLGHEHGRQLLIRRNWRFSVLPKTVLVGLLLVLIWEIWRQNMNTAEAPWCFAILGVPAAATLSGVFASLILAREQFARSMRPSIAWASQRRESDGIAALAWTAHLMNFGPGVAQLDHFLYTFSIVTDTFGLTKERVERAQVMEALALVGLREGTNFYLKLVTPGAPLPVAKTTADGIEVAALDDATVRALKIFDLHVAVADIMGDVHEKTLPFISTLPTHKLGSAKAAMSSDLKKEEDNGHA